MSNLKGYVPDRRNSPVADTRSTTNLSVRRLTADSSPKSVCNDFQRDNDCLKQMKAVHSRLLSYSVTTHVSHQRYVRSKHPPNPSHPLFPHTRSATQTLSPYTRLNHSTMVAYRSQTFLAGIFPHFRTIFVHTSHADIGTNI